jgi:hypothetical protein
MGECKEVMFTREFMLPEVEKINSCRKSFVRHFDGFMAGKLGSSCPKGPGAS